jgi:carboxymethylenebutenolidase
VVVLQELFGVNADIGATCHELAVQGFIAIAPDLFWRQEPGVDLDVTLKPPGDMFFASMQPLIARRLCGM